MTKEMNIFSMDKKDALLKLGDVPFLIEGDFLLIRGINNVGKTKFLNYIGKVAELQGLKVNPIAQCNPYSDQVLHEQIKSVDVLLIDDISGYGPLDILTIKNYCNMHGTTLVVVDTTRDTELLRSSDLSVNLIGENSGSATSFLRVEKHRILRVGASFDYQITDKGFEFV